MNALSKSRPGRDQRVALNAVPAERLVPSTKSAENQSLFAGTIIQDNSKRKRLIDRRSSNYGKPDEGVRCSVFLRGGSQGSSR